MADASDLEERLRRLEQSRNALALEVSALHHKEAERDEEKARNKRWVVYAGWFYLLVVAYCAVNMVLLYRATHNVSYPIPRNTVAASKAACKSSNTSVGMRGVTQRC